MNWKPAPALVTLREQLNKRYPDRNKAADGLIGDQAHAARKSDHNPDENGIVAALDVTHDPKRGVDCNKLAERVIQDRRVWYIIFNGRIRYHGKDWQPYTGSNPHDKHMHISVRQETYNDPKEWELENDMLVDQITADVMYRLYTGHPVSDWGKKNAVGKMTAPELQEHLRKSTEFKRLQAAAKAGKLNPLAHLPAELRDVYKKPEVKVLAPGNYVVKEAKEK